MVEASLYIQNQQEKCISFMSHGSSTPSYHMIANDVSTILHILIYLNNGNANTIIIFALTTDFEQTEVGDTYQSAI